VLGRRADGYHLLDSLVAFAATGDILRAEPADELTLTVSGPFGAALSTESDNLVLRAARALANAVGGDAVGIAPRARLTLEKHLPVASGIGGGSADAAAALRALQRLWRIAPSAEVLHRLALRLGADVPVCLASHPARMGGVGDILSAAPSLPPCGLLLVNPGVAVATPSVFRARTRDYSAPLALPAGWSDAQTMATDLGRMGNDLEAPAVALCPPIAALLATLRALPGCLLARMSGSGATCFGLFATPSQAAEAAPRLRGDGIWSWGGALAR
jgi:4-diphosphocytidyl-2-C-methyl-D-erythritol kinase